MDSYENVYKNICRICLGHGNSENMVSLIDNNKDDGLSNYGKVVLTFTDVLIKVNDYLPKLMCKNCLILMKQAVYFKLKCESSYRKLEKLIKNNDVSEKNFMEKIVEYTMFIGFFSEYDYEKPSSQPLLNNKPINLNKNPHSVSEINMNSTNMAKTNTKQPNDQNEDSCHGNSPEYSDIEPNDTLNSDDILDKLENMIGKQQKSLKKFNDSYKGNVKKRIIKLKALKRKHIIRLRAKKKTKDTVISNEKIQKLICKICRKVLSNQHTFDHHMQRHNGCRYICEHCGKGFPVLAELQIHQVARHGTGPYLECQQCPFKAARRFDLIEHERIHTGERPYTCDKCGLTFRRRGIWKKHLIYHMEKKIECQHCPRRFYQRSEMLAHTNNVHERVYLYLCNKCGVTYARPATVRRHLTDRHGIPREMQGKIMRINKGKGMDFPG